MLDLFLQYGSSGITSISRSVGWTDAEKWDGKTLQWMYETVLYGQRNIVRHSIRGISSTTKQMKVWFFDPPFLIGKRLIVYAAAILQRTDSQHSCTLFFTARMKNSSVYLGVLLGTMDNVCDIERENDDLNIRGMVGSAWDKYQRYMSLMSEKTPHAELVQHLLTVCDDGHGASVSSAWSADDASIDDI